MNQNNAEAVRVAHLERSRRYRKDEAILLTLARHGDLGYPDLDAILDLPQVEID